MIVVNQRHLQHVLRDFIRHYNAARPHQALDLQVPEAQPRASPATSSRIVSRPVLGGLTHEYEWEPPDRLMAPHRYVLPRTYPQLVTPEAEPDEDLVYGDATPVIIEWRGVRAEFLKTLKTGTTLDRDGGPGADAGAGARHRRGARADSPPASFPWDSVRPAGSGLGADAGPQAVRAERNRALLRRWLRRVLTVGLWRG